MEKRVSEQWLYVISSKRKLFRFNFREIWRYRDLLRLLIKRDIVTVYKQTILGPLWFFIQPLFTGVVFTVVFNNIANIETGNGIPSFLFNMAGITCWNYFKECLVGTSTTFTKNQGIFDKVYFPRVIVPMSLVISNLLRFGIQLFVFSLFWLYFKFFTVVAGGVSIRIELLVILVLIFIMGLLGLGLGMLVSSMTTKYRDLNYLITFGVQLLMYASGVMYPLELIREKVSQGKVPYYVSVFIEYNPMTIVVETFRYVTLSVGDFSPIKIVYCLMISLIVFLLGLVIFNKTEQNFIDTV